jgi:hypothetical protein
MYVIKLNCAGKKAGRVIVEKQEWRREVGSSTTSWMTVWVQEGESLDVCRVYSV